MVYWLTLSLGVRASRSIQEGWKGKVLTHHRQLKWEGDVWSSTLTTGTRCADHNYSTETSSEPIAGWFVAALLSLNLHNITSFSLTANNSKKFYSICTRFLSNTWINTGSVSDYICFKLGPWSQLQQYLFGLVIPKQKF